jgi:hypothetical protein
MLGHGVGQGGGLRIHALAALTFVGAGGFGLAAGLVLDYVGLLGASRGFFSPACCPRLACSPTPSGSTALTIDPSLGAQPDRK